jgi:hypothetical protein
MELQPHTLKQMKNLILSLILILKGNHSWA